MIPPLVASLRAGGAMVQASEEKMKRFLDVLYNVHIGAVRSGAKETETGSFSELEALSAD